MGLLIFAFRKLFLKRRINQLNGRQMQLSQATLSIEEQIGRINRNKAAAQSAFSAMMTNTCTQNTSIFQAEMGAYSSGVYRFKDEYKRQVELDPDSKATADAKSAMEDAKDEARQRSEALYADYTGAQQALTMKSNMMAQAMEASDSGELQQLKAKDDELSLEKTSNESMLKTLMGEYDSVEKAEDNAAKSEAPKFGLS